MRLAPPIAGSPSAYTSGSAAGEGRTPMVADSGSAEDEEVNDVSLLQQEPRLAAAGFTALRKLGESSLSFRGPPGGRKALGWLK